jgi:hypothetical protein
MNCDKTRIYADLMKSGGSRGSARGVILTCRGTHEDLHKHDIQFEEGKTYSFWMDDGDDEGKSDPLYFDGIVEYDHKAGHWVAWVNWETIHSASDKKP